MSTPPRHLHLVANPLTVDDLVAEIAALVDEMGRDADDLNARLDALLASPMNAAGQWPPNPPGVHSQ